MKIKIKRDYRRDGEIILDDGTVVPLSEENAISIYRKLSEFHRCALDQYNEINLIKEVHPEENGRIVDYLVERGMV